MYFRLLTALAGLLMCASYAAAFPFAYITNLSDNTVSVIDTKDNRYVKKVTLGTGVYPYGVAVSPDGKYVFVSNQTSQSISVIDARNDIANPTVVSTISSLGGTPSGLAINPAGTRLYVANNSTASVSVLDVSALTGDTTAASIQVASPTVGNNPEGVAVDPDGTNVYVANYGSGTVSVIRTSDNTLINTINVGPNPKGIAVGKVNGFVKIFVANSGSGTGANTVSAIDAGTLSVTPITVGTTPYTVAVAANGANVYVSNSGSDSVSVISTATNPYSVTTTYTLPYLGTPQGIAVTPDGNRIYAVNTTGDSGIGSVSSIVPADTTNPTTELINTTAFPDFFQSPATLGNFIGPRLYTITATAGSNGSVTSPDSKTTSAANNNTILSVVDPATRPAYTLAPDPLYRVDSISIDNAPIVLDTDPNYNKTTKTYTFSPVADDHSLQATFIKDFDHLSITRKAASTGSTADGSVTSSPAGVNCSASTAPSLCYVLFQEGTPITLTATPNPGKFFAGWVGDTDGNGSLINNGALCDGKKTTTCTFTMSTYTSVTAVFSDTNPVGPVRMLPQGTYFSTIQEAFNAADATTTEIQLSLPSFTENPNLINGRSFILSGGWPNDYSYGSQSTSPTLITGSLTITSGTITANNIAIN
ncbi:YncE family protein [Geotalea sp. SG265]|uniref:YncE family protein n=1 Tax=Geotalea sp. SG265 TaxID=2922867 RepID=UPI001FAF803C|nr:YncE family protein [Geotalea sp. SG265]